MKKYKPIVVASLHGFKSHGKWQKQFDTCMSAKGLTVTYFDYGYQLFHCLIPGFKNRLIKKFYLLYSTLIKNKDYKIDTKNPNQRPSIVVHSLGSYILCNAMLKYPDIRFDKIILCGSIVPKKFDWDLLFKRNQVHLVRNEYSPTDKVVRWAWVLSMNNSGHSGWEGFEYSSNSFEQEKFDLFDHSNFFDGNHMEEYWLPFFLKEPPAFQVIRGKSVDSIPEFTKLFDQTTLIDDQSFGQEPYWNEMAIPDGLAEGWVESNPDIYSFLSSDEKSRQIIGYINAMPLKKEIFEKLLQGKIHDPHIRPSDIISYEDNITEVDLYIMSVALNPDYQRMHLGIKDIGFEKLLNSLIDKLIDYYNKTRIQVKRIAAIGWTEKGIRLCKLFGMKDTGIVEEPINKPIYLLELDKNIDAGKIHSSVRKLIKLYKQGH